MASPRFNPTELNLFAIFITRTHPVFLIALLSLIIHH